MDQTLLMSIIGLIVATAALIILAYKNWSTIIYSAIAVLLICAFNGINLFDGIMQTYAVETGSYFARWFVLFVTGSIFGKIYQVSGAAATIASSLAKVFGSKNALLPIIIAGVILSLAGVSSFVLIFVMYPIALELFAKANLPKRLLPAVFCYVTWTVAAAMPASTQSMNVLPMETFGTGPMAGAVPGFIFAGLAIVIDSAFILWQAKKLAAQGIVFDSYDELNEASAGGAETVKRPGLVSSLLPVLVIIVGFNVLGWDVEIALFLGIILSVILFHSCQSYTQWVEMTKDSAVQGAVVLVNTAVIVGFGAVVVLTPLYGAIIEWVKVTTINPYLLAAISANVFAFVLGSATSAVNLSLQTLGEVFMGVEGINLGFVHRIICQAATGLDTLPHCGALLTVFGVCGVTHKEAYKYVGFCTVICPIVLTFAVEVPLCILLG